MRRARLPLTPALLMTLAVGVLGFFPFAGLVPAHGAAPADGRVRAGSVEGRVTDARSGDAVSGALVVAEGAGVEAVTDRRGAFRLDGLPAGRHRVTVRAAGYLETSFPNVTIRDGETTELDVRLTPGDDRDELARGEEREDERDGTSSEPSDRRSPPPPPSPPPPSMERSESAPARAGAVTEGSGVGAYASPSPVSPSADGAGDGRDGRERGRRHQAQAGVLTAGDVDDHLNFDWFTRYLRRAQQGDGYQVLPSVALDDRVLIEVVDSRGQPLSNARVRITAEGRRQDRQRPILDTQTTTGGLLAFFPDADGAGSARRFRVEVRPAVGTTSASTALDLDRIGADRTVRVRLGVRAQASRPDALDIAFVVDATGSMGDEMTYLTTEFQSIVRRLDARFPGVDKRFALVVYRDHGDEFVVRSYDFTGSASMMQRRLASHHAEGGGDWPEAMEEALDASMDLDWREGRAARMLFLVADAPPHDGDLDAALDVFTQARERGIRVYPLAASGVSDVAEYVMRVGAVLTHGRHLFLTDDSGVGNAHQEPRIPCYAVTRLDNLLVRTVASELEGRRVEADEDEIVREVGRYRDGVCEAPPLTYGQR